MDADVVIVGYGPVGSVLSILLAQRGHRVVTLERHDGPYPLPRAVHFDGEVARILQACGIGPELPRLTSSSGVYEWRNGRGDTLLRFLPVADSGTGWPGGNMFSQPELEEVLEARGAALSPLEVRRGVTVTGLTGDIGSTYPGNGSGAEAGADDGGSVTVETTGGPVTARWVVGCDGANSLVRQVLGVPVTDLGFFYDWLICDVILDPPRTYDPENLQVCDPARPTTMVSGGPGRRRWEFMRLPGEEAEQLNREETAWRLLAAWDVHPGNARLERHTIYTFQARWVERWASGRVLLAGDAAHLMPPFAGQGMGSGVRDAANLAWKLDLVLADRAPSTLLATYQQERQPHVRSTIELSVELGNVICVPDPAAAAERDAAMIAVLAATGDTLRPAGPVVADGLFAADDPTAGHLLVQGRVGADGVTGRFDDIAGAGWRLLVRPGTRTGITDELADSFASMGGEVLTVGPGEGGPGGLDDLDGTYRRWFDDHHADAVLQRPDFLIYGRAPRGAPAAPLIASLQAALTS